MARSRPKRGAPAQPTTTRKEYLRRHKDDRERRALLTVLGTVLAALVVFLAFGVYQIWQSTNQPVASVEGERITAAKFQRELTWQRWQLLQNMASISQLAQTSDPTFLQQLFGQQRTNLPQTTVDALIDRALIRQEAERRGIEVSDDEVEARLSRDLAPAYLDPTETPASDAEATGAVTDTEGSELGSESDDTSAVTDTVGITRTGELTDTKTASADGSSATAADEAEATATTVVTDTAAATATADVLRPTLAPADFEQAFRESIEDITLRQTGLSRSDFYDIQRQQLLRERLGLALGAEASITDKQVELDYLAFASEETARAAADALAGGAQWAEVVDRFGPPDATVTPEATTAAGDESEETSDAAEAGTAAPTSDGATPTVESDADDEVAATDGLTATQGLTVTDEVTDTGAAEDVDATDAVTPTATASSTPLPTSTPNPYALELGERRWYTRAGLKERLNLTDADADAVVALEVGKHGGPYSGTKGFYVVLVRQVEAERVLEGAELATRRSQALDDWLTKRRAEAKIDRYAFEDKVTPEPDWFVNAYEQYAGPSGVPTIDASSLIQSTVVVGTSAPAGDSTGEPPVVATVVVPQGTP